MAARFEGKVAVITGACSGIGLAVAQLIAAESGKVVLADLNADIGNPLASDIGADRALFVRCDVASFEEVRALIDAAVGRFGGVDILINNAGMGSDICTSVELSPQTWHKVIAVDLDSVFYGCKAAVPEMRKRGGGSIVNTASISGLAGDYGFNAYNAAKGAVVNYTRSLALDHAHENIRVNAVCPGLVETRLTSFVGKRGLAPELTQAIPMKRMAQPLEIAKLIAFLASEDASYMTGSIVAIDGGVTAGTGNANLPALMARAQETR
jgi:meso-butanediol dehydrogenase/(S,S)-butanediol dehydrogenase/diacetyl reductase